MQRPKTLFMLQSSLTSCRPAERVPKGVVIKAVAPRVVMQYLVLRALAQDERPLTPAFIAKVREAAVAITEQVVSHSRRAQDSRHNGSTRQVPVAERARRSRRGQTGEKRKRAVSSKSPR